MMLKPRPIKPSERDALQEYVDAIAALGGEATTRQIYDHLRPGDRDQMAYTRSYKSRAVVKQLETAAVNDLIDGEWVGNGYVWRSK